MAVPGAARSGRPIANGVTVRGPRRESETRVLTTESVEFLAWLHEHLEGRRLDLLAARLCWLE